MITNCNCKLESPACRATNDGALDACSINCSCPANKRIV